MCDDSFSEKKSRSNKHSDKIEWLLLLTLVLTVVLEGFTVKYEERTLTLFLFLLSIVNVILIIIEERVSLNVLIRIIKERYKEKRA